MYQNDGKFFICGDFNSRCGDMSDYLEGVDEVPDRKVTNHTTNGYGQFMCEFMWSANCCMLNGRSVFANDFTSYSPNGQSVVDYCVVPHESLERMSNFQVIRPRQLFEEAGCVGVIDPQCAIPDHALLIWEMSVAINTSVGGPTERILGTFTKYNLSGVDNGQYECPSLC